MLSCQLHLIIQNFLQVGWEKTIQFYFHFRAEETELRGCARWPQCLVIELKFKFWTLDFKFTPHFTIPLLSLTHIYQFIVLSQIRCFLGNVFFFNFIGVQLIYNIVLVSAVQQSESVIHIHIPTLFFLSFFPIQVLMLL